MQEATIQHSNATDICHLLKVDLIILNLILMFTHAIKQFCVLYVGRFLLVVHTWGHMPILANEKLSLWAG